MVDFDMTWKNPTEAQEAALAIAMTRTKGHGMSLGKGYRYDDDPLGNRPMTEFQIAELMCMADKSLWYTQAKGWMENPPKNVTGEGIEMWKHACKFIVDVVDSGYNATTKKFWDQSRWSNQEIMTEYAILMDFMMMLNKHQQVSLDVVSQGFEVFVRLLIGNNWKATFKKLVAVMKKTRGDKV